jgi:CRISPR-associated endonuclease Csy4
MNAYVEIRILPDPEFPPTTVMNALFSKLHRGLVAHGGQCIGVSFPDVGKNDATLGLRLRLHGATPELEKFMALNWLTGVRDHIDLSTVMPVPAHAKHRVVRRVQAKSSPDRQRRRLIARKGISEPEARAAIPETSAKKLNLPYVVFASRSTGQQFRLFVEHLPVQDQPVRGAFSAYGLSAAATVPWF